MIKQTGVTTRKKSPDILLALALKSEVDRGRQPMYDQLFLSNYALMQVKEEIARLPGVSDVGMLGQRDYSMRVWVDPEKLAARSMTAADVANAIRKQNAQVATGQIGQPPVPDGQQLQVPLSTLGRLIEAEQFGEIIVKKSDDGRVVRIKDVARVELGPKNRDISCSVNQAPAVSLAVFQLPDANALDTADIVKAKMEELAQDFPAGVIYEIRYDTTPFIRESINEVFKTLRDAVILVAFVVLLFLQNWRSALIPLVAVPVAIVGTFAVMAAMGFSLNNLTLFGLVLAIGIVVDDAIVVVEAVEHHVEHGMAPRAATDPRHGRGLRAGHRHRAGADRGVRALRVHHRDRRPVLPPVRPDHRHLHGDLGVQLADPQPRTRGPADQAQGRAGPAGRRCPGWPMSSPADLPGSAPGPARPRAFWEESALRGPEGGPGFGSWTPGERPVARGPGPAGSERSRDPDRARSPAPRSAGSLGWAIDRFLVWFFGVFNAGFRLATAGYSRIVSLFLRGSVAALIVYGGLLYLTYDRFQRTPSGFIPTQDMGYLLCNVQLPDSASLERTKEVMDECERIATDDARASDSPRRSPASRSCSAPTGRTSGRCSASSTPSRSAGPGASTARRSSPS